MSNPEQTTPHQTNPLLEQPQASLFSKLLAFILGAGFLVLAFMFSLVALAVIGAAGLAIWGWLWWKTRTIRKQMREQINQQAAMTGESGDGLIIEGEVIRETTQQTRAERLLSPKASD